MFFFSSSVVFFWTVMLFSNLFSFCREVDKYWQARRKSDILLEIVTRVWLMTVFSLVSWKWVQHFAGQMPNSWLLRYRRTSVFVAYVMMIILFSERIVHFFNSPSVLLIGFYKLLCPLTCINALKWKKRGDWRTIYDIRKLLNKNIRNYW